MKIAFASLAAASALALTACGGTADETTEPMAEDTAAMDPAMTEPMAGEGQVTVTINGVQPGDAPLLVALQGQDNFLQSAGAYTQSVDASGSTVTATFDGVTPGSYVAAVVHDQNNDGSINLGAQGPDEPWGISGSAQTGGAPEFMPAMFEVTESGGQANVSLDYDM
ncbi:MAG: DUF2141 domain-containing protein [Erythrobacter sp.]|nr:DUF2141 domain-containing protein [Erythrobacter sp.]